MGVWSKISVGLGLSILLLSINGVGQGKATAGELLPRSGWPKHLPYEVSDKTALAKVGGLWLQPAAAKAFENMTRAARQDGVYIVLRSAYRSRAHQSQLFYGVAAARGISLAQRARVSAPPGYSEHHTGYAVDLDDGLTPRFFRQSFERTRAGIWMMENAHRFCFELSFPRGNAQGIAYEPWHWRYIGTADAVRTFARARAHYPGYPASKIVLVVHGDRLGVGCGANTQAAAVPPSPATFDHVADASRHAEPTLPQQN